MDLTILLDSSTSITEPNFEAARVSMAAVLQDFAIDAGYARVAMVSYSDDVNVHFHLDAYPSSDLIMAAITRIPYIYGTSNLAKALKTVKTKVFTKSKGDREEIPNILLLITDGVDNSADLKKTYKEAGRLRKAGIDIIPIGVEYQGKKSELTRMASKPAKKNYFFVKRFDQLPTIISDLSSRICESKCSFISNQVHAILGMPYQ